MENNTHTEEMVDKTRQKNLLPLVIIFLIVLMATYFGYRAFSSAQIKESLTSIPTQQEEVEPSQPQEEIAMEEVVKHAAATDCWFVIEGKVYDVTAYIASNKHGGGDTIIAGCGKDATELFNTRPMGSGTPHSDKARSFLPNFQIGILK